MTRARSIISYACGCWFIPRRDCNVQIGTKCSYGTKDQYCQHCGQMKDKKAAKSKRHCTKRVGEKCIWTAPISECRHCFREREDRYRHSISKQQIDRLERIQLRVLRRVAGAFISTPTIVLLKELSVEPIEDYLERTALSYHQKHFNSKHSRFFRHWREGDKLARHPYRLMDSLVKESQEKVDEDSVEHGRKKDHPKAFPNFLQKGAIMKCAARWEVYRGKIDHARNSWIDRPTVWESWLQEDPRKEGNKDVSEKKLHWTWRYYENLPRAHATLLFHCRTGVIGLGSYLSFRNVRSHLFGCCGPKLTSSRYLVPKRTVTCAKMEPRRRVIVCSSVQGMRNTPERRQDGNWSRGSVMIT